MQAVLPVPFATGWESIQVIILQLREIKFDSAVATFDTDIDLNGWKLFYGFHFF